METKAVIPPAMPNLKAGPAPVAPAAKSEARGQPKPQARPAEDYRLIIERDDKTGTYVYTTIDRATGEVLQRLPREELLKMGSGANYDRGRVIDAKA